MKGLVLEIKGKYAMVLTEDGVMQKIKYSGSVGDEIEVSSSRISTFQQYRKTGAAAVAAAAAVVVGLLGYDHVYNEPTTFISIDGNSSFEYEVNRKNQVVAIKAIGEDAGAQALVDKLNDSNIKGKTVDEVLDITANVMYETGYLDGEDDHISVTVSGKDSKQVETLTNTMTAAVEQNKSIALDVKTATMDQRAQAIQSGVSTGQYLAESTNSNSSSTESSSPSVRSKASTITEELTGTSVASTESGKEQSGAASKPSAETAAGTRSSAEAAAGTQTKPSGDTQSGKPSAAESTPSSPVSSSEKIVNPASPETMPTVVPVEPSTEASSAPAETDATAAVNPEILAAQAAEEAAQKIALEAAQAAEEAAKAAEKIAQEAAEAARAAEAAAASVPSIGTTETTGAAQNPTVPDVSSLQAPGVQLEDE